MVLPDAVGRVVCDGSIPLVGQTLEPFLEGFGRLHGG
jgi:hypothetical protein